MSIGLPDVKGMSDREFILWVAGASLLYMMWVNPSGLSDKIDKMSELQAQMILEHKDLLKVAQVQCINHADNVTDKDKRIKQQRRCLTLQVNTEVPE